MIRRTLGVVLVAMGLPALSPGTAFGSSGVKIVGGADESGQNYHWTVTNESDSPIVAIEIPHFRGALQVAPAGWSSELTNPRGVGGLEGVFKAKADSDYDAIRPGVSKDFGLRITVAGAQRGRGAVTVRFADGHGARVDAELPVKASLADRNVSLIGLGAIFVVYLLTRSYRRRRGRMAVATTQPGDAHTQEGD